MPFTNASRVRSLTFSGLAADAQVHPTEGYTGSDPSDDDLRYRSLTAVDSVNKDVHLLRLVLDEDRDFVPNAHDDLPLISGQWEDSDSDGFGDLVTGPFPDACPSITGTSTFGLLGCLHLDNDGWDETTDDCPNNRGTSWFDRQGARTTTMTAGPPTLVHGTKVTASSSIGSNPWTATVTAGVTTAVQIAATPLDNQEPDLFPYNPRQYKDTDGDGWGTTRWTI